MQYTFFSAAHETFSKIYHILGHKTSLNKFKKIEIIPCIISDNNNIKWAQQQKKSQKIFKYMETGE
jgi:hypothetical protein